MDFSQQKTDLDKSTIEVKRLRTYKGNYTEKVMNLKMDYSQQKTKP